jgi:hypothetical protein
LIFALIYHGITTSFLIGINVFEKYALGGFNLSAQKRDCTKEGLL